MRCGGRPPPPCLDSPPATVTHSLGALLTMIAPLAVMENPCCGEPSHFASPSRAPASPPLRGHANIEARHVEAPRLDGVGVEPLVDADLPLIAVATVGLEPPVDPGALLVAADVQAEAALVVQAVDQENLYGFARYGGAGKRGADENGQENESEVFHGTSVHWTDRD